MTQANSSPHPLFPVGDDDDPPDVSFIHVVRIESGRRLYAPRLFEAGELTSLAQLSDMFGGGSYVLQAKDARGARITAQARYDLDGPSKRLDGSGEPDRAAPAPMAPVQHAGADTSMLLAMLSQQAESARAQQAMMLEHSRAMTTIMVGLLQNMRGDGGAGVVQAIAAFAASGQKAQAELLGAVLSSKAAGGGSSAQDGLETFLTGVEFHKTLASNDGDDGVTDTIMQVLGGAMAAKPPDAPSSTPSPTVLEAKS